MADDRASEALAARSPPGDRGRWQLCRHGVALEGLWLAKGHGYHRLAA